jgi:periplasmic protein TonB
MMKNLKYISLFILLFAATGVFAQEKNMKEHPIFTYVEQMPTSGYDVVKYIDSNLRYPDAAKENNIEGRVMVRFLVDDDGSIKDCSVARGLEQGCDNEAVRVISGMRKWNPAKQNGKAVPVYFTYPVIFKLK